MILNGNHCLLNNTKPKIYRFCGTVFKNMCIVPTEINFQISIFFWSIWEGDWNKENLRLVQAYLCCVSFPATTKRWGFPLKVSQWSQISGMEAQKSVTTWTVFRDRRLRCCHPQILVSIGCFETWVGGSYFCRHKY